MDAYRLPIYGVPTRRRKSGFYRIGKPAAPPPVDGLPLVGRWPLDDNSWVDLISGNNFSLESASVSLDNTGFLNGCAHFLSYGQINAAIAYMNQASWKMQFYVKFPDFLTVEVEGIARIATYGSNDGSVFEWYLAIEPQYDGPTIEGYFIGFYCGSYLPVRTTLLTSDTWHSLQFGLEYPETSGNAYRVHLSIDGGVPDENFEFSDPDILPSSSTGVLALGGYYGFKPNNHMRIDEVELRQAAYVPPQAVLTSHWPLDDTFWTDIVGGHSFQRYSSVTISQLAGNNAAYFSETGALRAQVPSMLMATWSIEFYLWFDDLNLMDFNNTYSSILAFTGGFNEAYLLINQSFQLQFSIGESALYSNVVLDSATRYLIEIGYRESDNNMYLKIDGAEETASGRTDANPFIGMLEVGYFSINQTAVAGMKIDEMKLKRMV